MLTLLALYLGIGAIVVWFSAPRTAARIRELHDDVDPAGFVIAMFVTMIAWPLAISGYRGQ